MIFILLMVFGIYWASTAQSSSLEEAANQQDRTALLETAKLVMGLPEITCSKRGVTDTACVDTIRLQALRNALEDQQVLTNLYKDRFLTADRGSYKLTIKAIRPGTPNEYRIFDYTENHANASRQTIWIPTVIHNPITNYNQLGVIELTHEVVR